MLGLRVQNLRQALIVTGMMASYAITLPTSEAMASGAVNELVKEQVEVGDDARTSQKRVDAISEETQKLLDEYRMVLRETENLRIYNDQMERLTAAQIIEQQSIRDQIVSIEQTNKEVVPLMLSMLESLDAFVGLDVPFLPNERSSRLSELKEMMDRADVSTSEKYRRVLEAYQVEGEYGRTIEAYRDSIERDGEKLTVDLLRIGRVALIYQTLDGDQTAVWDHKQQAWQNLPSSYRRPVAEGLRIARKQVAPDLLTLPIPAPEVL